LFRFDRIALCIRSGVSNANLLEGRILKKKKLGEPQFI
jgi:hypothetical protein